MVYVPRSVQHPTEENLRRLGTALNNFRDRFGREPETWELAQEMGMPVALVQEWWLWLLLASIETTLNEAKKK